MKALIIEDEIPAADKLLRYLTKYDKDFDVLKTLTNVKDSISWLEKHQDEIDLIFMDIQLTDGLSFEIFDHVKIQLPVIFTTAYDEYAIDAFKVNSIDYLLKPITFTDLSKALNKWKSLVNRYNYDELATKVKSLPNKKYKDRFLVKKGNHIHSIPVEDIAIFLAEGRTVFLINKEDKKYIIDYNLGELEDLLDPQIFFRCNRSSIVSIKEIKDVIVYSSSRLMVKMNMELDKEILVSRDKVNNFKKWLAGGA